MNTQEDNALALGKSLDPGKGPSSDSPTATTPLPEGWHSFCSEPYYAGPGRWYATAPWNVAALGKKASAALSQTVDAPTWPQLHSAVAEQIELHRHLA